MPKKAKLVIPMPENCDTCPLGHEKDYDVVCPSGFVIDIAMKEKGRHPNCPLEEVFVSEEYDPEFGDNKECECGHSYYRHFDSYEDMAPVGCKYCNCHEFKEKK